MIHFEEDFGSNDNGESPNEFDDEAGQDKNSSEFAKMLEASFGKKQKKLSVGDKIKGEILVLGKEDVFVSTGTQHDGIVPRRDLVDKDGNVPYKVGDVLDLFVTQARGSEIYLSPKPTAKNLADDLEDAFDMILPVEGRVVEVVKGGFRVQIMGKLAFCPVSQMDSKFVETPEEYVGKRFTFRITQFSEGGRNIVISRRKILDEEREVSAGSFFQERKAGDIVQGRVARLEKFGAFVELAPGVDGLLHISELAWSRVNDPSEVVSVGQEINVKILKIEGGGGEKLKISLSLKQAGAEPWENLPSRVQAGNVVEGRVTRCMSFGAFVELAPGVEGLIPLSEMSYTRRVIKSDELVKEGETVSVMIKEVNPETRRISLSLKDAGADPWALITQKFPVGAIVTGKVERREGYGIFVKLDDGITGLLPKSKAIDKPEFPFEKLKVGDSVTVQVGEIKAQERKISLDVPGDPHADDWKKFSGAAGTGGSLGTLGGAFGDKLRAAMENKSGAGAKKKSGK